MNHRACHLFYTFRCPKCNLRPQVGTPASLISYLHTNQYILQALLLWDPVGLSVNSLTNHLSHKLIPAYVRSPIFPTLQKSASFCWIYLLVGTQFLKRVSAHCTVEKSNFLTSRRFLCSCSYLPIPTLDLLRQKTLSFKKIAYSVSGGCVLCQVSSVLPNCILYFVCVCVCLCVSMYVCINVTVEVHCSTNVYARGQPWF